MSWWRSFSADREFDLHFSEIEEFGSKWSVKSRDIEYQQSAMAAKDYDHLFKLLIIGEFSAQYGHLHSWVIASHKLLCGHWTLTTGVKSNVMIILFYIFRRLWGWEKFLIGEICRQSLQWQLHYYDWYSLFKEFVNNILKSHSSQASTLRFAQLSFTGRKWSCRSGTRRARRGSGRLPAPTTGARTAWSWCMTSPAARASPTSRDGYTRSTRTARWSTGYWWGTRMTTPREK